MKKTFLNAIAVFAIVTITLTTTSCEWLKKTFGGKSADPKDSIAIVDSLQSKGDSVNATIDTISKDKDSVDSMKKDSVE